MKHYIITFFALISVLACLPCMAKDSLDSKSKSTHCHTGFTKTAPYILTSFALGLLGAVLLMDSEIDETLQEETPIEHVTPLEGKKPLSPIIET